MMYSIYLPIGEAELDDWRSHRMFGACKMFAAYLDETMYAKAEYIDHERHGWTFYLTNKEDRDRLAAFHDRLRPQVLAEKTFGHPVDVGSYDAAKAFYQG